MVLYHFFSTVDQEKDFTGLDAISTLETQLMFYYLILLKVQFS